MSSDIASRIAKPGDPDLDCDVHDLVITAVITDGREILLRLVGGTGRWHDTRHDAPGVDVRDADIQITMRYPDMPEPVFTDYAAQLQQWRDAGTRLRMCAAPGRTSLLIENRTTFLPVARRQPRNGAFGRWDDSQEPDLHDHEEQR